MQVQHKAAVQAPPHSLHIDLVQQAGYMIGDVLGPVLLIAFVAFWGFVVFRAFRWFFRATR